MTFAAAQATDFLVLGAIAVAAAVGLTGLASFDPRMRARLPGPLGRGNAVVSVGLILVALAVAAIALG